MSILQKQDDAVYQSLLAEQRRQTEGMELIPSENYVSAAVLEAMGTIFTNKYSEGYPGKRYYGGQVNVDVIENLAIDRAKQLFGAEHVNVQPYSGSPANYEVYFALLNFGDKVLGMKLDHGGHITHGLPIGYGGKAYNFVAYGVDPKTHRIDMDQVRDIALKEKPKMIIAGFSAYSRTLDWKAFRSIADEVGAIMMADIAHIAGLIAGGVIENPVPYFDVVTTTTHKTLRGPRGAMIMCKEAHAKAIDKAVFPGMQGGPHDHTNAAKAVAFKEALDPSFKTYAQQIVKNAKALADTLTSEGFTLISGGTDNHLMLVDLTSKNISGKEAELVLDEVGITVNKNTIPFEPRTPFDPSGIRLGTPAITTRGMQEPEMQKIGKWISQTITNAKNPDKLKGITQEIRAFSTQFPVPGIA